MKFAIYKTSGWALKKASAAVSKNGGIYGGFTMLELVVVVVIIGILATLAYSGLTELIFVNRAKETAQTIRTFTERALIDAKRMNKPVRIYISTNPNAIIAADTASNGAEISREALSQGFLPDSTSPPVTDVTNCFNRGVKSQVQIGISGITGEGFFAACGFKGYCAGTVKRKSENSFKAYIRRGTGKSWEVL